MVEEGQRTRCASLSVQSALRYLPASNIISRGACGMEGVEDPPRASRIHRQPATMAMLNTLCHKYQLLRLLLPTNNIPSPRVCRTRNRNHVQHHRRHHLLHSSSKGKASSHQVALPMSGHNNLLHLSLLIITLLLQRICSYVSRVRLN